jgi:hypothetical protein
MARSSKTNFDHLLSLYYILYVYKLRLIGWMATGLKPAVEVLETCTCGCGFNIKPTPVPVTCDRYNMLSIPLSTGTTNLRVYPRAHKYTHIIYIIYIYICLYTYKFTYTNMYTHTHTYIIYISTVGTRVCRHGYNIFIPARKNSRVANQTTRTRRYKLTPKPTPYRVFTHGHTGKMCPLPSLS